MGFHRQANQFIMTTQLSSQHVAYMHIFAVADLLPGEVVYSDSKTDEEADGIARATNDSGGGGYVLGVADRLIAAQTQGTIVAAGIVTVKKAGGHAPLLFGAIVTAERIAHRDMPPMVHAPVGTLIEDNVEGIIGKGGYTPGMRVFLCPWMRGLQLQRVYTPTGDKETTRVYTEGAKRIKETTTETIREAKDEIDLSELFGARGFAAFKNSLGIADDGTEETLRRIQEAVYAAQQAATWCGVQ